MKPKIRYFKNILPILMGLFYLLLLSACAPSQDSETSNVAVTEIPLPIYETVSLNSLHLNEPFDIANYFIRNEANVFNHYYIDSNHVLWGYGFNDYGQLGNGKQYISPTGYEDSFEPTPQRIAENVVHVDYGESYVIYLTNKGDLYGIGSNQHGVLGSWLTENSDPPKTVVTKPTLLLQNVTYARAASRGIIALQKDKSVWWWGKIMTTSAKNVKDTTGVCYPAPQKMLDNAIYVTCGDFSMAAIKEDGSLWTWGNNTFGSCGIDSNDKDFIEEPVMVLSDVKMVWMDKIQFDSASPEIDLTSLNPYECVYTYVTFVEKKDGSLWATGPNVKGLQSKSFTYMLYGDILRSPDSEYAGEEYAPVTVSYSDVFQPVTFSDMDKNPQLKVKDLTFGMSSDQVIVFLDTLGIHYQINNDFAPQELVNHIVIAHQTIFLWFDDDEKLTAIVYLDYGTRNGQITCGMTRQEAEAVLGSPLAEAVNSTDENVIEALYEDDSFYHVKYHNGLVICVTESMTIDNPFLEFEEE